MRVGGITGVRQISISVHKFCTGELLGFGHNFPTFSPRLGYSLAFLRLGHQVVRGWTEPGISPSSALPLHRLTETFMTGHDLGACSTNGRLAGNRYRCCAAYLSFRHAARAEATFASCVAAGLLIRPAFTARASAPRLACTVPLGFGPLPRFCSTGLVQARFHR